MAGAAGYGGVVIECKGLAHHQSRDDDEDSPCHVNGHCETNFVEYQQLICIHIAVQRQHPSFQTPPTGSTRQVVNDVPEYCNHF